MTDDDGQASEVEPLRSEDRAVLRERLERDVEALRAQLDLLRSVAAPVSLDLAIGRVSRIDALQQQQMASATRRRLEVQLQQSVAALRRLDRDDFGECASCGDAIGRRRLLARPAAPLCRSCEAGGG
jgi:DnaK suppressor protein